MRLLCNLELLVVEAFYLTRVGDGASELAKLDEFAGLQGKVSGIDT